MDFLWLYAAIVGSLASKHNIFIPLMYIVVLIPILLGYFLLSPKSERFLQMSLSSLMRRLLGRHNTTEETS